MTSQFEKYELLVTPLLLVIIVIFIYFGGFIEIVLGELFFSLFLLPSLIGNISGILITIIFDIRSSRKIRPENIGGLLRYPTYILVIIAILSFILANTDTNLSLLIVGTGLGGMTSIIATSSIFAYYHGYFIKKEETNKL